MTFILGLLSVVAVGASILLMVVILLQEPKGGGLAAALGGSGMEAIGVNTGSVNKFTAGVATVWVVACLLHAFLMPIGVDVGDHSTDAPGVTEPAETPGETPALPGEKKPK